MARDVSPETFEESSQKIFSKFLRRSKKKKNAPSPEASSPETHYYNWKKEPTDLETKSSRRNPLKVTGIKGFPQGCGASWIHNAVRQAVTNTSNFQK